MAAITPVELHPHLRWRMADDHMWRSVQRLERHRPGYLDEVLSHVRDEGAIVAGDLDQRVGPKGTWWDWDDGKLALELLFHQGRVAAVRRPSDFARVYDLAERVLPAEVLARPTPTERDARKELIVRAARHHGVGTLADLADYHRQLPTVCKPLVAELVEDGRLLAGRCRGLGQAGLPPPRGASPAPHHVAGVAQPVRPGGLVSGSAPSGCSGSTTASRSTSRSRSAVRLLRVAVPARRRVGRTGRSQGRPGESNAARAERLERAWRRRGGCRRRTRRGALLDGRMARPRGGHRHRPARQSRPCARHA